MDHVGTGALIEAYQLHDATRTTRSLLFCVTALLDALDQEEPLKTLGLHLTLTHDDPRLYLISHASLARHGFSIGQANVYQMLATEHRLYIPFSLPQLLVDLSGKALPRLPCTHTRTPTLQEIADRLNELTFDSLPLALAHTIFSSDAWQGLGLLSGSRLSDIITAPQVSLALGMRLDDGLPSCRLRIPDSRRCPMAGLSFRHPLTLRRQPHRTSTREKPRFPLD